MATWELQLVSRIIRTGDLNSVVQWGITLGDFLTREGHALYSTILGYYESPGTAGSVLGPGAMRQVFPNFVSCDDSSMTTDALCHEVRKSRLSVEIKVRAQNALEMADYDPMDAINKMQMSMMDLQNIGFSKQTDVCFNESFSRSIRKMELLEKGVDLSCGTWPWPPLQKVTGGLQPAEFVILYGRPKNMKTWVLAFLIAWFHDLRKRILIYTKEMTADNIFQRAGACLAQVRYHEFRVEPWLLTWMEKQSIYGVERMLHKSQLNQNTVCLSGKDAAEGGDTVPWLRSKVEMYRPDIVFVDGMYLMTDAKGSKKPNEKVGNISNDLRRLTIDTNIPVIATIQANREAAKNREANLDEIGFSDRVGQDATLLMRCINEKDSPTVALIMGGASREFQLNGFRIYGEPATDFNYAGEISDKDIEKAKESDTADESGDSKHTPTAKKKNGAATKPTEGKAVKNVIKKMDKMLPPTQLPQ